MILLLLFVTCLVTVTNLMLVIVKEPGGREGAGGHPERGSRGFLWGFLFSVFFEWLRVFSVFFFSPAKDLYVSGCGVCVFIFLVGGG